MRIIIILFLCIDIRAQVLCDTCPPNKPYLWPGMCTSSLVTDVECCTLEEWESIYKVFRENMCAETGWYSYWEDKNGNAWEEGETHTWDDSLGCIVTYIPKRQFKR